MGDSGEDISVMVIGAGMAWIPLLLSRVTNIILSFRVMWAARGSRPTKGLLFVLIS